MKIVLIFCFPRPLIIPIKEDKKKSAMIAKVTVHADELKAS
jgi:hypothetical protein